MDGWAGALGTQLRKAGVPVRAGYPVGDPPAGEREDVDDPLGDRAASRLPVTILEESLQALKRLRDQDLITEEEYRQKKKELLDRF